MVNFDKRLQGCAKTNTWTRCRYSHFTRVMLEFLSCYSNVAIKYYIAPWGWQGNTTLRVATQRLPLGCHQLLSNLHLQKGKRIRKKTLPTPQEFHSSFLASEHWPSIEGKIGVYTPNHQSLHPMYIVIWHHLTTNTSKACLMPIIPRRDTSTWQ